MSKFKYVFPFSLLVMSVPVFAADSQSVIDQLGSDYYSLNNYEGRSLEDELLGAPQSEGDDDIGVQLILRKNKTISALTGGFNTHVFYSDNVTNVDVLEQSGFIFTGELAAAWKSQLKPNLFGHLSASQSFYQYENNIDNDFTNSQLEAGLIKLVPEWDVLLRLDLEHQIARRNLMSDKIHNISTVRLGAFKNIHHSPRSSSYVGLEIASDVDASNSSIERDAYTFRVGHSRQFTDKWKATAFVDYSYYDYQESGREDKTTTLGVQIEYAITQNISFQSSVGYVKNDSDTTGFDYDTGLGSLGISLKARF